MKYFINTTRVLITRVAKAYFIGLNGDENFFNFSRITLAWDSVQGKEEKEFEFFDNIYTIPCVNCLCEGRS